MFSVAPTPHLHDPAAVSPQGPSSVESAITAGTGGGSCGWAPLPRSSGGCPSPLLCTPSGLGSSIENCFTVGLLVGCSLREFGAQAPKSPLLNAGGPHGWGWRIWCLPRAANVLSLRGARGRTSPRERSGSLSPAPLLRLEIARPPPEDPGLLCLLRAGGHCGGFRPHRGSPRAQQGEVS